MMISVIIPLYNAQLYIDACLGSCVKQKDGEIEIIIVNDGSTDQSLNIAQKWAKTDNRIKIITQENQGLIRARKRGVNESIGEYIFFLDSDDTITDNALDLLAKKAKQTNADIIVGNIASVLESGKVISTSKNHFVKSQNENFLLCSLLMGSIMPSLCGRLIRHTLFDGVELPEEYTIGEDVITNLTILKVHKPTYALCDDLIYNYIQHPGSMVNTRNKNNAQKRMNFILWVNKYICNLNNDEQIENASTRFFLDEYFSFLRDGGHPNSQPEIRDLINKKYLTNQYYKTLIPVWRIMMLKTYRFNYTIGRIYRWVFVNLRAIFR